jgi:hypothetical protein
MNFEFPSNPPGFMGGWGTIQNSKFIIQNWVGGRISYLESCIWVVGWWGSEPAGFATGSRGYTFVGVGFTPARGVGGKLQQSEGMNLAPTLPNPLVLLEGGSAPAWRAGLSSLRRIRSSSSRVSSRRRPVSPRCWRRPRADARPSRFHTWGTSPPRNRLRPSASERTRPRNPYICIRKSASLNPLNSEFRIPHSEFAIQALTLFPVSSSITSWRP